MNSRIFFIFSAALLAGSQSWAGKADDLTQEAGRLFFNGKVTKAAKMYEQAVKIDSACVEAYLNGAVAFRSLGDNERAIRFLEEAAELRPADADIPAELGWLYFHEHRLIAAKEQFEKAAQGRTDHVLAMLGLGAVLTQLDEPGKAVRVLADFKKLRPNLAAADYLTGRAFERSDDPDKAYRSYLAALKKDWTFSEARPAFERAARNREEEPSASTPSAHPQLRFTQVQLLPETTNAARIRVGIWTSPQGRPRIVREISFEVNGPFQIFGTKKPMVYAEGNAGEIWKARVKKKGTSVIVTPAGKEVGPFQYTVQIRPVFSSSTILIQEVLSTKGKPENFWNEREFRGAIEVVPSSRNGIYLDNEISVDEYLLGVLPSEIPPTWPIEAQKAQAVIARNQAIIRKIQYRPHRRYRYDLCNSQHCQVYRGVRVEKENSIRAVIETMGEYLCFNGKLAQTFYHASCGGHTRSSSELRGWGAYPYLEGVADGPSLPPKTPWDILLWIKDAPEANCYLPEQVPTSEFRWIRIIPRSVIEKRMRRFRVGKILSIVPGGRTSSGHINELVVKGTKRSATIRREDHIRHFMGDSSLRSTLFLIEAHKDSGGNISEFWIYGGGWGHSVGLCQTGMAGLALKQGKSYGEILKFYYPGTELLRREF